MKKRLIPFYSAILLAFILIVLSANNPAEIAKHTSETDVGFLTSSNTTSLHRSLHLDSLGLPSSVFNLAIKGFEKLKMAGGINKNIIAICDFSQASSSNRFYVIDLAKEQLLFNTFVAHGKNSGEEFAQYFSNEPSSLKSSPGFFSTKETYIGKHGLSLKLNGLEPGINNNAEERAIVMHGADYVSKDFIDEHGRLGRSFGCPAVPNSVHKQIIETLKGGCCLFIYSPNKNYLAASALLK